MNTRPTVLVVDDDPSMRAVLGVALRRAGYSILTAASGPEALELLASGPIEFMITDGCMSAMNGFELSRRAKSLKPNLHIAMLSAVYAKNDALGTPIERFFEKPATASGLIDWLRNFSRTA